MTLKCVRTKVWPLPHENSCTWLQSARLSTESRNLNTKYDTVVVLEAEYYDINIYTLCFAHSQTMKSLYCKQINIFCCL